MSIATGNVTSTAGNMYVSTGNTAVTWLSLTNYSAGNVTANLYVVPAGGTAGNLNTVLANIEIGAGDTYQIYNANEKLILANNDAVQANANADNSLNVVTSYTNV